MIELMITLVVMAFIVGMTVPNINRYTRRSRVDRAAYRVAMDLQNAFSLAARQRKPVRISITAGATTYTLADRASGSAIVTRKLGSGTDYGLSSVTFSPTTVDVFPNGTSTAALTVTLTSSDYSRTVTISSAGYARVVPLS